MSGDRPPNGVDQGANRRRSDAAEATGHTAEIERLAGHTWMAYEAADAGAKAADHLLDPLKAAEHHHRLAVERERTIDGLHKLANDLYADSPLLHWLDAPTATRRLLGLPTAVDACVFDLDSVLTTSTDIHLAAWAEAFDAFLLDRAVRGGEVFVPFDRSRDYTTYLAGRPRLDGIRLFLASRGLTVPQGSGTDDPALETVHGLANRKARAMQRHLDRDGVAAYIGSRCYLEAAKLVGIGRAVVSASASTGQMLERAGLDGFVDACVDAHVIESKGLHPKPAPDTLLAACELLGSDPTNTAAFETTPSGIEAARLAGMALVVGLQREGATDGLLAAGADVVVSDLAELLDGAANGPNPRSP